MKKKILILGTSDFGGVTNYVASYINRINDFDFILTHDDSMNKNKIMELFPEAALMKIPHTYTFLSFYKTIKILNYKITYNKIDIVHAHTLRAGFLAAMCKLLSKNKIRLLYTGHGLRYTQKTKKVNRLIFKQIEKLVNSISDKVIFIRELDYLLAKEEKLVSPQKSNFIRTQLPPRKNDSVFFDIRAKFNISTPYVIINAASIYDLKNPDLFIEVAKRVIAKCNDFTFVWFGEGITRYEIIAKIEKLGLSNRILFPGAIDAKYMLNVFEQVNALLLTSKIETFSLAILEAYLTNTLVLSSDFNGVGEIIKDKETGFIFNMNNPNEASKAILEVFGNEDRLKKVINQGKSFFEKCFNNIDGFTNNHVQLYKQILK